MTWGARASVIGRVALVATLAVGCTAGPDASTPAGSGQPATPSSTTPTSPPTAPPAPTSHVVIQWEPIPSLEELVSADHASVRSMVAGPSGFAAVGVCTTGLEYLCPKAWHSTDGLEWTATTFPAPDPVALVRMVAGPDGYVLAGFDGDLVRDSDDDVSGPPSLWRSPDGITWERLGHMQLESCCADRTGKLFFWSLAVAPSGDIVAGFEEDHHGIFGPVVGNGSGDWTLIQPQALGLDSFVFDKVFSTPSEVVLFGSECTNCPEGTWTSTDGRAWTEVIPRTIPTEEASSFASNGSQTVAAVSTCLLWRYPLCGGQLWSPDAAGSWAVRVDVPESQGIGVRATGSAFIADSFSLRGQRTRLVSLDGLTWSEFPGDGSPCDLGISAARNDTLIAGGACGWWRGTLEVVPGAAMPYPTPGPTPTPPPTMDPNAVFQGSVVVEDTCRSDATYAIVDLRIAWTGEVPIDGTDVFIDGQQHDGGSSTAETSGSYGLETYLTPGEHHLIATFYADLGEQFKGPVAGTVEQTFSIDPTEPCD